MKFMFSAIKDTQRGFPKTRHKGLNIKSDKTHEKDLEVVYLSGNEKHKLTVSWVKTPVN